MTLRIRPATLADLPAVNQVVEAAVMQWDLPERVKRLSLNSYRYNEYDLQHLTIVVALTEQDTVAGVAAWEAADPRDTPEQRNGLLLHGLYVAPDCQHRGIGSQLLQAALDAARAQGLDGLLVKAQKEATGFFQASGMTQLPVEDSRRHYATRFWTALGD